jgi:hypothetical protein
MILARWKEEEVMKKQAKQVRFIIRVTLRSALVTTKKLARDYVQVALDNEAARSGTDVKAKASNVDEQ